jgi:UDP-N-acetylmuramate dehydrogenase
MREMPAPFLAPRTTLRVGGTAIAEIILERSEDLYLLPDRLKALGGTPLVLGAGSNILAQDGELPLVLIRPFLVTARSLWASTRARFWCVRERAFLWRGCCVLRCKRAFRP